MILLFAVLFISVAIVQSVPPSLTELITYVQFSSAAYCSSNEIESWTCGACKQATSSVVQAKYIQSDTLDVYGYVAQLDSQTSLVSFRGTNTNQIQDWIDDLNFTMVSISACTNCEVHGGFLNSWNALSSQVTDALSSFHTSNVIFTGHSLGGALAVLGSYFLAMEGYNITAVATVGAPRVGNVAFASAFYQPFSSASQPVMARMVHADDIVPHVLIEDAGFAHSAQELWFDDSNNVTSFAACSTTNGEDPNCSDSVLFPISVSDHLTILGINLGGNC
jgi:Lipase (class 3)